MILGLLWLISYATAYESVVFKDGTRLCINADPLMQSNENIPLAIQENLPVLPKTYEISTQNNQIILHEGGRSFIASHYFASIIIEATKRQINIRTENHSSFAWKWNSRHTRNLFDPPFVSGTRQFENKAPDLRFSEQTLQFSSAGRNAKLLAPSWESVSDEQPRERNWKDQRAVNLKMAISTQKMQQQI